VTRRGDGARTWPRAASSAASWGASLAAALTLLAGAWTSLGDGDATASAAAASRPPSAGLEQGWLGATGAWAVVAMGHLAQHSNTFWQVLFRPNGTARWNVVTPPGVASNGGFAADGSSGQATATGVVTVGFEPSHLLRYSPIARTNDDGKAWSAGTLSSGLLPVADAVAGAANGRVLALVRSSGGTLVSSSGSLTRWTPVVTRRSLDAAGAGRSCGVAALTAVVDPAGSAASPELGAACAVPGVVGLFHESGTQWVATGATVPGGSQDTLTVLRLESGASGTSALLEAKRGGTASLFGLWRARPGVAWAASAAVRLHGEVLSATAGGGASLLVLTGRRFGASTLLWVGGPGTSWRSLGRAPAGTQVVVPAPGSTSGPGDLDALSVSGSHVSVWARTADGPWHRTSQRLRVPLEYGSST
jgi:hypothetical protein